ncbi:OmpA family protein [Chitinophaga tropicalis]|uniref:OmpA family protein n=1 Tax=Chitinophaga tropicalis TaxID=2683588 RepID=A0A7K1UA91_9BACT|nr:OmpA family protein [Chitinophaga tropicalis]MVT11291.1 OmpA family protein [Chitinophaga tropicalis]
MKAILLILLIPIFVCWSGLARAQQTGLTGITYQAVARDAKGSVYALKPIQIRFSILAGSPTGTAVYVERQSKQTTLLGLFSATIGQGTPEVGSFNTIPWSNGNQYLKVEIEANADGNFMQAGVMPFMAVPYALYAANGGSGNGSGGTVALSWLGTMATPPTDAKPSQAYYNSTDKRSYIMDSTSSWQILAQDGTSITWLGEFATDPSGAAVNQAYYNITDKKAYIYDGSTWQVLSEDGKDGSSITWLGEFATAPTDPLVNQAYHNIPDRKSYIWDGTAWQVLNLDGVSISWLGTFATAPASPTLNQAYYNSTDRKSYIWDGTAWQPFAQDGTGWNLSTLDYLKDGKLAMTTTANGDTLKSANRSWLTNGNSGIDAQTDFIGTLDTAALVIKTNGNGAQNERIRFTKGVPVLVNGTADTTTAQGLGVFTVFSGDAMLSLNKDASYKNAINGYSNGGGNAIFGRNYSNGAGVKGVSSAGPGIWGYSNTRIAMLAVKGEHTASNGGIGVFGTSYSPPSSTGGFSSGVYGWAQNTQGIGVIGMGNNINYQTFLYAPLSTGAGVVGNGNFYGVVGVGVLANMSGAAFSTGGTGVAGGARGLLPVVPSEGAGVSGAGFKIGTAGYAITTTGTDMGRWGGYFAYGSSASTPVVWTKLAGMDSAGVVSGIISSGPKNTLIKDAEGNNRLLYCTEAPEVLFQDFGTGELVDGTAHIALEQLLTHTILVDAKHPLKVFIQLEGECNGVYVTNKSAKGFDVKELQGGKSNVSFTWQIVASRADETLADGSQIVYTDKRFPKVSGPIASINENDPDARKNITAAPAALKKAELKKEESAVVNTAFANLQFATAKAEIAASSLSSLDKMASLLKAHPGWHLKLSGHTDNEGSEAFNQTLSEKRSEAVKQYLVEKGVPAEKITTIGYGQTKPIATNNSKAAKEKNRRVEMEILTEE